MTHAARSKATWSLLSRIAMALGAGLASGVATALAVLVLLMLLEDKGESLWMLPVWVFAPAAQGLVSVAYAWFHHPGARRVHLAKGVAINFLGASTLYATALVVLAGHHLYWKGALVALAGFAAGSLLGVFLTSTLARRRASERGRAHEA